MLPRREIQNGLANRNCWGMAENFLHKENFDILNKIYKSYIIITSWKKYWNDF